MTGSPFFLTTRAPEPSEWTVVGWSEDPVRHGNLESVTEARRRYTDIARALESAVARLDKITGSEEQLKGEYADALREKTEAVHELLRAAAVRYADVAREVTTYEPELAEALTETRAGLADGKAAAGALSAAEALPDGEPDEDGVLDDAAAADDRQKQEKIATADTSLAAAKKRVQSAFDRLQVAGKHLGHTVSARRYDDGLTDSGWDKVVAVFKKISKVLAIIGMVLAVLCFIFPGVAALLVVAAVVAVAGMVVAAVLYSKNEEGLPDLIFAIVGVVLLGGAAWATTLTRTAGMAGRAAHVKNVGGLKMPPKSLQLDAAGNVVVRVRPAVATWKSPSDWFDNPLTKWVFTSRGLTNLVPEVGFVRSSIEQLKAAGRMWGQATSWSGAWRTMKDWFHGVSGLGAYRSMKDLRVGTGVPTSWKPWVAWTSSSSVFTIGAGLIWTGGRTEWRDWRDQQFGEYGKLEDL